MVAELSGQKAFSLVEALLLNALFHCGTDCGVGYSAFFSAPRKLVTVVSRRVVSVGVLVTLDVLTSKTNSAKAASSEG